MNAPNCLDDLAGIVQFSLTDNDVFFIHRSKPENYVLFSVPLNSLKPSPARSSIDIPLTLSVPQFADGQMVGTGHFLTDRNELYFCEIISFQRVKLKHVKALADHLELTEIANFEWNKSLLTSHSILYRQGKLFIMPVGQQDLIYYDINKKILSDYVLPNYTISNSIFQPSIISNCLGKVYAIFPPNVVSSDAKDENDEDESLSMTVKILDYTSL